MDTIIDYNLTAYLIYLPVAIVLTLIVSHQLFKNGKIFMLDIFHKKEEIAFATNSLFKIGFYLLNIGFALLITQMSFIEGTQELVVRLSTKLGGFSIYLGVMLMLNLFLFMRGRRKSMEKERKEAFTV